MTVSTLLPVGGTHFIEPRLEPVMLSNRLKRIVLALAGESGARRLRRAYLSRTVARNRQIHEREMRVLPSLVRKGDVVADIGANVGLYTTVLADLVGSTGKVYAFEPIEDNYEILLEVIRRAGLRNVQAKKLALGRAFGTGRMVIPSAHEMEGYYQAHLTNGDGEHGRHETVSITSIDALCDSGELTDPNMIKCDVEGGELDVLAGAARMLERARPTMLIEVSRTTSDACFQFLADLGYRAFVFDGARCVPTSHYLHQQYSNYFFAHSDSESSMLLSNLVLDASPSPGGRDTAG